MTNVPVVPATGLDDGGPAVEVLDTTQPAPARPALIASAQDGQHPRPQLIRAQFQLLDGPCGFAFDDESRGIGERWFDRSDVFDRSIVLPFSPESAASGIGETGFHQVVWYRREISAGELGAAGLGTQGQRMLLHLGAADSAARLWVDGQFVGEHRGGQTALTVDITDALDPSLDSHVLVLRAEDDPLDAALPRGKQDWHEHPHVIWYHRVTGIWRSIWLEAVPQVHIAQLAWTPDVAGARLQGEIVLSARPAAGTVLQLVATLDGQRLGRVVTDADALRMVVDVPLPVLRNGQAVQDVQWSPGHPRLVDVEVSLSSGAGALDVVSSYAGLRSVAVGDGCLLLNDRPFYLRSVLQQGYWADTHYTPPTVDAMREEIALIKRLGFNSIRIHQKVEDARYLYWCDRLGLTVWAEAASAYEFSPQAIELYSAEWIRVVQSLRSHPSIIAWVPFNESWGIQHVASNAGQHAYSLGLTNITRAIDPTRPVISNDGWEHTGSDIITLHDYESSGSVLRERYGSAESTRAVTGGVGPHGRRSTLTEHAGHLPVMLTEFGGVRFDNGDAPRDAWGYSSAATADEFEERLTEILGAVTSAPGLAGFCYTQLTDTGQEMNGLCDARRVPKLPEAVIRAMVLAGDGRSPSAAESS